ncbi:AAA family ATPase [Chitinophaga pinensis]|uniref:AAA family ATPase n=1 Tax=Chitinophaga pinensis (strain ATCC 43595 / DSM 2588 / LMG 13176 / NBRC 15968 / NCIMB 11800 / UQM 2034) TaxID=485918 RepID=A0A979G8V7_CHIPD|nr:AAA family ATPase [Chitinophaga pinensis]ACU63084.1 hypothetical protein Cpin_5660 [Chitinophaga pinensis DSM 2588]
MNSDQIKIALSGKSGSGKTEIAKFLAKNYNLRICHTGALVRKLAIQYFASESKDILQKIDDSFNNIERGVWLKAALREIDNNTSHIVIDSLRYIEDYEYAKRNGFSIWRIECEQNSRYDRLRSRGQLFSTQNEMHSSECDLDGYPVDVLITNNSNSLIKLHEIIQAVIK